MRLLLKFTDRPRYELLRLTLALSGLCRSVAASDTGSKSLFLNFSHDTNRARELLKRSGSGRAGLLSALETAGSRLERTALDMDLHGLKPDPESVEALLFASLALRLQADFIARPSAAAPLPEAAKHTASASKVLLLAGRAARAETRDYIPNLKFCTIYSDLERTVSAIEDYAELLARAF